MRTIKIRAWNKKDKKWFDGYTNTLHLFAQDSGGHGKMETEDYIYSMNTGLLDKNGKEIYEGDLLRNIKGGVREVQFLEGGFWLQYPNGDKYFPMEAYREIVGNIYESPLTKEE